MERLQYRARQLLCASVAPNSLLTYNTALRAFQEFRKNYKLLSLWPIPVTHLTLFLSFCFEKGLSPKSITTYFAGINYFHKLQGHIDLNSIFAVNKILEGCRRSRASRDKRTPLTKPILVAICNQLSTVCYDAYEMKLFTALFTLAYFGLFRVSELTANRSYQGDRAILISDISIGQNKQSIVICLRHYKTNQYGRPVFIKLPRQNDNVCPVAKLVEFLEVRPRKQPVLFCHENGAMVTRTQFTHVLSMAIGKTCYRSGHFRSHSFRIGRATDLASLGYASETIMKLGRWSSNCYKLYIRN